MWSGMTGFIFLQRNLHSEFIKLLRMNEHKFFTYAPFVSFSAVVQSISFIFVERVDDVIKNGVSRICPEPTEDIFILILIKI